MGRPKKDPAEKASVVVTLRLTPGQAEKLDQLRGGRPRTEYLMGLLRHQWTQRVESQRR